MKKYLLLMLFVPMLAQGRDFKVRNAVISYDDTEPYQVVRAIGDLKRDIALVTGLPTPDSRLLTPVSSSPSILIGTYGSKTITKLIKKGLLKEQDLKGKWESYVITVTNEKHPRLVIAGSDKRGTIYGIYDVSQRIGVSPWYWWADVPVAKNPEAAVDCDYYASGEPTVKYRGIFINDEDWGLKPWASTNFEKELGDIGPKTYAKVCELLLRLKANMLAPAMHTCTGAFYTHPESKVICDSFGIIITTSHCEPLLLNNADKSEWDEKRDGDWNYKTNREAIYKKWDDRLAEASQYENIYTTAMRGVHDARLQGNLPMQERVPLIEQVFKDQRHLLVKHKAFTPLSNWRGAGGEASIPQIFVPYKETMDIYENGLQVPDDITLVWVDDNYGYMKRVSNPEEQKRSGRAGVYYHISYLGAPHDYLWINTTPPVLMYEELKKAFDHGADRYWLLNVGDIKPMELGIQTFMDLAWNIHAFDFDKVHTHQAELLTNLFGGSPSTSGRSTAAANNDQLSISRSACRLLPKGRKNFQFIFDEYYRLAWSRKPEFMGWEREWDDKEHTGLKPTEFSFDNYDEAQRRLADYQRISDEVEAIANSFNSCVPSVASEQSSSASNSCNHKVQSSKLKVQSLLKSSWFELVQHPVQGAYQMNRKFLMAQLNQELLAEGRTAEANWAARQMEEAYDSINALNRRYNEQLDGKWRGMMALAPAFRALSHLKPEVTYTEGAGEKPVDLTPKNEPLQDCLLVDLSKYTSKSSDARLVKGLGYDWQVMQLGETSYQVPSIPADSIDVFFYTVPFWPIYKGKSNRIAVSVDGSEPQVFENQFKEYSRSWKDQVLRNGVACRLRFPIDRSKASHTLTFRALDPGQMLQKVIIDWGGLQPSYLGPSN